MSKIILTDVDDTVLSYAETLQSWLIGHGVKFHGRLRDVHSFSAVSDLTEDRGVDLITQFALEEANFARLPAEGCAKVIIPRLYAMGYEFVAISACGNDPRVRAMRLRNLEDQFGFPWKALHTVGYTDSKAEVLRRYAPTYWVEDNRRHAIAGDAAGHRSFLLDRQHNLCTDTPDPRFIRVSTWWDIYQTIQRDAETPPLWWCWSQVSPG